MTRANPVAVAADYADALLIARRAKNILFLIVLLVLVEQIAIFGLVRGNVLKLQPPPTPGATAVDASAANTRTARVLEYVTPAADFLGITLSVVLAFTLLLVVMIMLVGRLIGVAQLTSAFLWCVLLVVLLFPWQALLVRGQPALTTVNGHTPEVAAAMATTHPNAVATPAVVVEPAPSFRVPGVLYTWSELSSEWNFSGGFGRAPILGWARFIAWPVIALILLLLIQIKSSKGLSLSLGEAGAGSTQPLI